MRGYRVDVGFQPLVHVYVHLSFGWHRRVIAPPASVMLGDLGDLAGTASVAVNVVLLAIAASSVEDTGV